jgi:hypothetical protein
MKIKFKKNMPILMAAIVLFTSVMPTFAQVIDTETVNISNNAQTEVFYNQESSFEVIVPKLVDLGVDKMTNYEVTVSGDISSDEVIKVIPEESFLMKDKSGTSNLKADVEATVTQDKTEWIFNEFATKANGNISAPNLTAGNWEGSFFFNIKLTNYNINVIAKNEAGEDLNASATYITGKEKENLLNSLIEEGFINSIEEVDALINVESDDFEGIADTTFDVSSIYKEGDKIVILHFNETKQEWEYIGQETVDANGLIKGDFTSYSPVAFIKVTESGDFEKINKELKFLGQETVFFPGNRQVYYIKYGEEDVTSKTKFTCNNKNVTIDKNGIIQPSESVKPGTIFTVTAEYEGQTISRNFEVVNIKIIDEYTGEELPITWTDLGPYIAYNVYGYETCEFNVEIIGSKDYSEKPSNSYVTSDEYALRWENNENKYIVEFCIFNSPNFDHENDIYMGSEVDLGIHFAEGGKLGFWFILQQ